MEYISEKFRLSEYSDGQTPYIQNDEWYIGGKSTGVKAVGADGSSLEVRYQNAEKAKDLVSDGWQTTMPAPEPKKKTFMQQKLSNQASTAWSTPIQISAEDGTTPIVTIVENAEGKKVWKINDEVTNIPAEGQDGKTPTVEIIEGKWVINSTPTGINATGPAGKDGTNIEYVYYRSKDALTNLVAPSYTNGVLTQGWTQSPQGITSTYKYEYMSVRTKKDGENWSDFSTPVIWSKWGEKGFDGDGVEYKYCLISGIVEPSTPPKWPTPQGQTYTWEDEPSGVTANNRFEYVVAIKTTIDPATGNKTETQSATGALWSKYSVDGKDAIAILSLNLSNDSDLVPATSTGVDKETALGGAKTTVTAFKYGVPNTKASISCSVAAYTGNSLDKTNSITADHYSYDNNTFQLKAWKSTWDSVIATFSYTDKNDEGTEITVTKDFVMTKFLAEKGETGEAAVDYSLKITPKTFNATLTASPQITVQLLKIVGSDSTDITDSAIKDKKLTFAYDGTGYDNLGSKSFTWEKDQTGATVRYKVKDGIYETERIETVSNGEPGSSPYSIELSNDSATIGANSKGEYSETLLKQVSKVEFRVFEGSEDITNDCEFSLAVDGGTVEWKEETNVFHFTKLSADTATATITVTGIGSKTFTISKVKQGDIGDAAITYTLTITPNGFNTSESPEGIIPGFYVTKYIGDSAQRANSGEYQIRKANEDNAWNLNTPITEETTFDLYIKGTSGSFDVKADSETVGMVRNGEDSQVPGPSISIETEYAYYLSKNSTPPNPPTGDISVSSNPDTGVSGQTKTWTKNPSGVTSNYSYEFQASRKITTTNGKIETDAWGSVELYSSYYQNVQTINTFNTLTGNSTQFGVFGEKNGQCYINANFIKSGALTVEDTENGNILFEAGFPEGAKEGRVSIAGWNVDKDSISKGDALIYSGNDENYKYDSLFTSGKSPIRFGAGAGTQILSQTFTMYTSNFEETEEDYVYEVTIPFEQFDKIPTEIQKVTSVFWDSESEDEGSSTEIEAAQAVIDNDKKGVRITYREVESITYYVKAIITLEYKSESNNKNFAVLEDGSMYATGAEITGVINASGGKIGAGAKALVIKSKTEDSAFYLGLDDMLSGGGIGTATSAIYLGTKGISLKSEGYGYGMTIKGSMLAVFGDMNGTGEHCRICRVSPEGVYWYYTGKDNYLNKGGLSNTKIVASLMIDKSSPSAITLTGTLRIPQGSKILNSNSASAIESNRNVKNNITPFIPNYEKLFDLLKPVTFCYNEGTSGRRHGGFIAQEVREAIEQAGLTTQDFAAYIEDVDNSFIGLRYEEFIPLNTWQIQKLKLRMTLAEEEVAALKYEILQLRTELNSLKGNKI